MLRDQRPELRESHRYDAQSRTNRHKNGDDEPQEHDGEEEHRAVDHHPQPMLEVSQRGEASTIHPRAAFSLLACGILRFCFFSLSWSCCYDRSLLLSVPTLGFRP